MTETIVCRSPAEIDDTNVTDAHSYCVKSLACLACRGGPGGPGLSYEGSKCRRLVTLRDLCEAVIMGTKTYDEAFRLNPVWQYMAIVNLP